MDPETKEDAVDDEFDDAIEDEFDDSAEEDFDVERQLCPDETCVGVLDASGICKECGASAEPVSTPARSSEGSLPAEGSGTESAGVDLLHRSLCPDGGCIGLLGPDGRCKECGRVGDEVLSDPRLRGLRPDPDEEKAPEEEEVQASTDTDSDPLEGGSDTFADRQLCPDGSCIGVIGSSGTCKECGSVA